MIKFNIFLCLFFFLKSFAYQQKYVLDNHSGFTKINCDITISELALKKNQEIKLVKNKICLVEQKVFKTENFLDKFKINSSFYFLHQSLFIFSSTRPNLFFNPIDGVFLGSVFGEVDEILLAENEISNQVLRNVNLMDENKLDFSHIFNVTTFLLFIITLYFVFKYKKLTKEKEQLNEALATKNKQLLKVDRGKNKLFSIISHDLRSPIASLSQVTDLLLQDVFSEVEKKEVYDNMRNQLDSTSRMLNNLLIWSSAQLNGTKVNFTELDLVTEITEILEIYKVPCQCKKVHITHKKIDDSLLIKVDAVQLHVILHNLISNALKYTLEGKNIFISYKESEKDITLHIFNEGEPISLDRMNHILEKNAPVTSLKGTDGEFGTGLGLYLIKKYIKLNKAQFFIEPIEEKGTLVKICFSKNI